MGVSSRFESKANKAPHGGKKAALSSDYLRGNAGSEVATGPLVDSFERDRHIVEREGIATICKRTSVGRYRLDVFDDSFAWVGKLLEMNLSEGIHVWG